MAYVIWICAGALATDDLPGVVGWPGVLQRTVTSMCRITPRALAR